MSVVQHSYVEAKTEIKECTSDVSADDQHHTSNEKKIIALNATNLCENVSQSVSELVCIAHARMLFCVQCL